MAQGLHYPQAMSNGIDRAYSSAFFASYTPPMPAARETSSDIEDEADSAQQLSSASPAAGKAATQTASSASNNFFGEDGLTFRDVLDAVNPLNHIPIVSGMLEEATGHKVSTGSKLMGGLMTGPVGFVASLANAIFEQGTGKGVTESMVASLSGSQGGEVQVASAATQRNAAVEETQMAANTLIADPVEPVDVNDSSSTPVTKVASKAKPVQVALNDGEAQKTLLELYGGSVPSAHRSYKAAQMRSYFNDVKHSQVL